MPANPTRVLIDSRSTDYCWTVDVGSVPAEAFTRTDTAGAKWSLADQKGKSVLLLFFLGGKRRHCMQQLQVFGKEFDAPRS